MTAPLTQPHELRGRRVLVIGTFDPTTPRARQWFRLLDRLGCDVEVMNVGSWGADRASDTAGSPLKMLRNVLTGLLRAVRHLLTCRRPDLVVFLYPGHLDACVLGPIARLRRVPTVLDVFISLYDTVIVDRGLRSTRSPVAFATRALDTWPVGACSRSWSTRRSTPTSSLDSAPRPVALLRAVGRRGGRPLRHRRRPRRRRADPVVPHLHPLARRRTVARAAALLAADGATFRLVGDGQQRRAAEQLARELGLTNIEFVAPVPESELPVEIARASICLGVFGTSDKAARVVPEQGVPVRRVRSGDRHRGDAGGDQCVR